MKEFFKSEPFRRGARTFIQAAAGYIALNIATADFSTRNTVIAFLAAGVAAGIAAIMNIEPDEGGNDHERN